MANKKQTLKIAKYFFNFPKVAEFGHAVYERVEGRTEGRKRGFPDWDLSEKMDSSFNNSKMDSLL